jgi:hypothetical protein
MKVQTRLSLDRWGAVEIATAREDRQVLEHCCARCAEPTGPVTASKAAKGVSPGSDVAVALGTDRDGRAQHGVGVLGEPRTPQERRPQCKRSRGRCFHAALESRAQEPANSALPNV